MAEEEFPITPIHQVLSQEEGGWLNTSRPLQAEELKGRIILVDFWTFCCINCIHVIPELQELEAEFGEDLTVIGVHSAKFANERDTSNIRNAVLRYDIEHAVINDNQFKIWQRFGVRAWPTLVLINPLGQVETVVSGEGHKEELQEKIKDLIAEYGDKLNRSSLPYDFEKYKAPESILKFPGKLEYAENIEGKPALFVADSGHNQIVISRLDGTIIKTIGSGKKGSADGSLTEAEFNTPQGLLFDGKDKLYIADTENHMLRMVDFSKNIVTTLAGTGERGSERAVSDSRAMGQALASPWDLQFYPDKNHIAIAMAGTHQLWSYDITAQTVSVLAGNGKEYIDDGRYPLNSLSQPSGLSVLDNVLYFVDSETSSLRSLENGKVTTHIGTGLFDFGYKEGFSSKALMQHPLGLDARSKKIYIADSYNHSIRIADSGNYYLKNYSGTNEAGFKDGSLKEARFNEPNDVLLIDGKLYVADTNNHAIRTIDLKEKNVSTLALMPQSDGKISYSDSLPNLEKLAPDLIQRTTPFSLNVDLPEGWKLNKDAPSYLALFEIKGKEILNIRSMTYEQLIGKTMLPALEDESAEYILQGTLYYCRKEQESICYIKSVSKLLTPTKGGGSKAIRISIHTP